MTMDAKLEARLRPGTDYHPLQVFPFFRRWKPSSLRNLVFTAIMSAMIVALIAITIAAFGGRLSWRRIYEITMFTVVIAYMQHFLYRGVIGLARTKQHWARWIMHPLTLGLLVPVGGIYIGYTIALWI